MRADGSNLHRAEHLTRADDSEDATTEDFLSPDKRHLCVLDNSTPDGPTEIYDTNTRKITAVVAQYGAVMWLNNCEFAEVNWLSRDGYPLTIYDLRGKQLHCVLLTIVKNYDNWQVFRGGDEQIWPDPMIPGTFFDSQYAQMSNVLFWIDPRRRLIRYLTASDYEGLSPDEKYFCTCSFSGPSKYERRANGTWRTVLTSSLVVVNSKTLKIKVLQGGLVVCSGSDWRGGKKCGIADTGIFHKLYITDAVLREY